MYQMYAADPRARLNLGIRRRLAPLMDNDAERIKLMNSLLLSMPGSPIIYYGDEIGMGDNFFLGDRNGVRTPMQWSPDRNAGLLARRSAAAVSAADHGSDLRLRGGERRGAERDRSSLLNWMKRMLQVRKTSQAFGRGTLRFIRPGNRKVLVYLREYGEDSILCVANLSRSAQPVELDLSPYKGSGADRVARPHALPAGRRAAVPADAAGLWLLLVQAEPRRAAAGLARRAPAARRPAGARAHRRAGTASSPSAWQRGAPRPQPSCARSSKSACCRSSSRPNAGSPARAQRIKRARLADGWRVETPLGQLAARRVRRRKPKRWPRTVFHAACPSPSKTARKPLVKGCSLPRSLACANKPPSACWPTRRPMRTSAAPWSMPSAPSSESALEPRRHPVFGHQRLSPSCVAMPDGSHRPARPAPRAAIPRLGRRAVCS